nr:LamG domain-containing protein [uncultured Draconibacterium sp.]
MKKLILILFFLPLISEAQLPGFRPSLFVQSISGDNGLLNTLISCLELDGSGNDAHGSNDATVYGATYVASGKIGGCYLLNGSSDHLTIPYSSDFDFNGTTNSFSYSVWLKFSSVPTANKRILGNWDASGGAYSVQLRYSTSATECFVLIYDGSNGASVNITTADMTDGNWHNIVVTVDHTTTTLSVYADGSLEGSADYSTLNSLASTGDMMLGKGKEDDSSSRFFNGYFDQFAIWDRALSSTDAATVATAIPYSSFTVQNIGIGIKALWNSFYLNIDEIQTIKIAS